MSVSSSNSQRSRDIVLIGMTNWLSVLSKYFKGKGMMAQI